jgi:hypothetical protein
VRLHRGLLDEFQVGGCFPEQLAAAGRPVSGDDEGRVEVTEHAEYLQPAADRPGECERGTAVEHQVAGEQDPVFR